MFKHVSFLLICICLFSFTSCLTTTKKDTSSPPDWIYNPAVDGKIGGVGSAGLHIKGNDAQREMAISRAIDSIARQMGVKVQNTSVYAVSGSSAGTRSSMNGLSIHTVSGATVNAVIKEMWRDKKTGELFVWMQKE